MFGLGLGIHKWRNLGGLSLASIFSTYNFTNMWSAENINTPSNQNVLSIATDEYVNADNVLTPLANTTTGTISMWVKPIDATPTVSERFFAFGDTDDNSIITGYITPTGTFVCVIRNSGTIQWQLTTDASAFSDATWTHIALVQNATSPVLYVDGVAVAQSFLVSTDATQWFNDIAGLDNGRLGCGNTNSGGDTLFFNGSITDVLFTSDAKTAPQIADIYNDGVPKNEASISNAVAYYRFSNALDNYNSDVANEWNFYDNISSIQSSTVNCEEGDVASEDVSAELITYDYAGEHDLANAVGEQPTLTTSSDFGGKPVFQFSGAQGFEKIVSNWRSADSLGMITTVLQPLSDIWVGLAASDNGVNNNYLGMFNTAGAGLFRANDTGGLNRLSTASRPAASEYGTIVLSIYSTGTAYKIWLNGIEVVEDMVTGVNDGMWFSDIQVTGTDNITIGKILDNSPDYGSQYWAMSGYHSVVKPDADIQAMHEDFMTYYGMTEELIISQITNNYNITQLWYAGNNSVSGTTTTLFDVKGQYDVFNPGASNQPTLVSPDSDFNNYDSFDYDGINDYLSDTVTDWRGADSSGAMYFVFETGASLPVSNEPLFSSQNIPSNNRNRFEFKLLSTGALNFVTVNASATVTNLTTDAGVINTNTKYVAKIESSGSAYDITINNVSQNLNFITGTDDGDWMDNTGTRLNIIPYGFLINGFQTYWSGKGVLMCYTPYLSASEDSALTTTLMDTYNIS